MRNGCISPYNRVYCKDTAQDLELSWHMNVIKSSQTVCHIKAEAKTNVSHNDPDDGDGASLQNVGF
jgi:hypothetical protein